MSLQEEFLSIRKQLRIQRYVYVSDFHGLVKQERRMRRGLVLS